MAVQHSIRNVLVSAFCISVLSVCTAQAGDSEILIDPGEVYRFASGDRAIVCEVGAADKSSYVKCFTSLGKSAYCITGVRCGPYPGKSQYDTLIAKTSSLPPTSYISVAGEYVCLVRDSRVACANNYDANYDNFLIF